MGRALGIGIVLAPFISAALHSPRGAGRALHNHLTRKDN
jgi:hypothetical protein